MKLKDKVDEYEIFMSENFVLLFEDQMLQALETVLSKKDHVITDVRHSNILQWICYVTGVCPSSDTIRDQKPATDGPIRGIETTV